MNKYFVCKGCNERFRKSQMSGVKDYCFYCNEFYQKQRIRYLEGLVAKLDQKLNQQPIEWGEEIATRKIINNAVRKMIKEDMSYFCGIDGISDYFYYEKEFLQSFRVAGKPSPQLVPKLIELTMKHFKGYPYEGYGWTETDIKKKVQKYVEAE